MTPFNYLCFKLIENDKVIRTVYKTFDYIQLHSLLKKNYNKNQVTFVEDPKTSVLLCFPTYSSSENLILLKVKLAINVHYEQFQPTWETYEIQLVVIQCFSWHQDLGNNTRQGTPKQVRSPCVTGHFLVVFSIYLGIYICVVCYFCCQEKWIEHLHYL
jgi:hypothetical protein